MLITDLRFLALLRTASNCPNTKTLRYFQILQHGILGLEEILNIIDASTTLTDFYNTLKD